MRFEDFGLESNPELDRALHLIVNTDKNVFVTGPAGSGKSTLLNLIQNREVCSKNVIVLGSTGISAVNVGGVTIHSQFHFPPSILTDNDVKIDNSIYDILNQVDVIVIDEISMVNPNLLDYISLSLQNYRSNYDPFGGVQLLLFGDLYQLPPVIRDSVVEKFLWREYKGYFFFNSHSFKEGDFEIIELNHIFRQDNPEFIGLLNRIRKYEHTKEDLSVLNSRVMSEEDFLDITEEYVYLATTNKKVDQVNDYYMKILSDKPSRTYYAEVEGRYKKPYPTKEALTLREETQIMVTKNFPELGIFNGTLGEIESMDYEGVRVITSDGRSVNLEPVVWPQYRYGLDSSGHIEKEIVGKFKQLPLKIAYSLTIHKTQGLTLDGAYVDLGIGAFTSGQLYTGISRVRKLETLAFKYPVTERDIRPMKAITKFLEKGVIRDYA